MPISDFLASSTLGDSAIFFAVTKLGCGVFSCVTFPPGGDGSCYCCTTFWITSANFNNAVIYSFLTAFIGATCNLLHRASINSAATQISLSVGEPPGIIAWGRETVPYLLFSPRLFFMCKLYSIYNTPKPNVGTNLLSHVWLIFAAHCSSHV